MGSGGYKVAMSKWEKTENDLIDKGINPETFEWREGKVGGDPRAFAAVAATLPMANDAGRGFQGERRGGGGGGRSDRGGGRHGGRGNGRGGDRNKFSWRREDGGNHSKNTSAMIQPGSGDTSRWDEAAGAGRNESQEGGIWVQKTQTSSGSGDTTAGRQAASSPRQIQGRRNPTQIPPPKKLDACPICKATSHAPASCPQAFCERCGKLGHLASVCVEFLPWDCIAPMCAFSAKGQDFYYIHDSCTARQMKERETSVVITIVEAHTSTKDMEFDLSQYIATGWRCTARAIGPGVFIVRFPNRRDVSKACYTGRMTLKSTGTVVKIDRWTSALGAKGVMEKAWIKVSNVP